MDWRKLTSAMRSGNPLNQPADNLEIPRTDTPTYVYLILGIIGLITIILMYWLLSNLLGFGFIGVLISIGIFAYTTEQYTLDVDGYNAVIVLNNRSGEKRTLFEGTNYKLTWEEPVETVDLKTELGEVMKDETYASKDSVMLVKYVYTITPNVYSVPDPGANVILWNSFEHDAIKRAGRALFSQMISDFFKTDTTEEIIKMGKDSITKTVFESDDKLQKFQEKHGARVHVIVEDVDRSKNAQKARDAIAQAGSAAEAINILHATGMSIEEATLWIKVLTVENVHETIFTVKGGESFKNVRDITMIPPGLLGGGGKK